MQNLLFDSASFFKDSDSASAPFFSAFAGAETFKSTSTFSFSENAPASTILISLDNSDNGWPLHFTVKPLYQPKGARSTIMPLPFNPSATSLSAVSATDGEDGVEDKCTHG
ncbi:Uncharacterised protein [uncultured archaeon]|nr:Uncharacterised protein [uncultured archaeon]